MRAGSACCTAQALAAGKTPATPPAPFALAPGKLIHINIDEPIARASKASGSEIPSARTIARELCIALDLPPPNLAVDDNRANDYVFERSVLFQHGDGSSTTKFIDCYRRGAFVLENKKIAC